MLRKSFLAFVFILLCGIPGQAHFYLPPDPLPKAVQAADIVAIVRVENRDLRIRGFVRSTQDQIQLSLIRSLKGDCPQHLETDARDLDGFYYGMTDTSLAKGDVFLALLVCDGNVLKLKPNPASLIKLSPDMDQENTKNADVVAEVERIISRGLKEESLRLSSVFFLSQFDSVSAMRTLAPYVDDKNDTIADYALSCFARNQQASAIPRIIERCRSFGFGGVSVPLISDYRVKEAKPFLEKALFSSMSGVRSNSMLPLSNLADKDSIPYLLLGLFDEDPQKFVGPYSAGILHKLLPEVPNEFVFKQYQEQKKREQQLFLAWWRDELAGKHPRAEDDKDRIILGEGQTHDAKELPQLNEALFMRDQTTRRAAVQALNKLTDQSSCRISSSRCATRNSMWLMARTGFWRDLFPRWGRFNRARTSMRAATKSLMRASRGGSNICKTPKKRACRSS